MASRAKSYFLHSLFTRMNVCRAASACCFCVEKHRGDDCFVSFYGFEKVNLHLLLII